MAASSVYWEENGKERESERDEGARVPGAVATFL
jgi:hypothetical protein